jgi:uncharacterized RDD family membrane protein YckC
VDLVLIAAAVAFAGLVVAVVLTVRPGNAPDDSVAAGLAFGVWVAVWLYFAGMESSRWQATVGKRLVGIRVCDLGEGRPTFVRTTARYFGKTASFITLLIGFFMAGWTARKQALHDFLADTIVVEGSAPDQTSASSRPMSAGRFTLALLASFGPFALTLLAAIGIPVLQPDIGVQRSELPVLRPGPNAPSQTPPAVINGKGRDEALRIARDSVAIRLLPEVAPKRVFADDTDRREFEEWLASSSNQLKPFEPDANARMELLKAVDYDSARSGLHRNLVLAVIRVGSSFDRNHISADGAVGYMQVLPVWVTRVGDGDAQKLSEPLANIRYGTVLLRLLLDEHNGDLFAALNAYRREVMGHASVNEAEFPDAVLAAWRAGGTLPSPAAR